MRSAPPAPRIAAAALDTKTALLAGLLALVAGVLGGLVAGLLSVWAGVVALAGYVLGGALIAGQRREPRFGVANAITLSRFVGGCWVGALTVQAVLGGFGVLERLLLVTLATVLVVLDGVDGWVARTRGEASAFGARFDVETDTLLLLNLSLVVPILGVAGWWVVLLSGLRYGYVLTSWFLPVLRVPLTPTYAAKVICVSAQGSLLVALLVDLVQPGWAASLLLATALGCLVWSFARDIRRQARLFRAAGTAA